MKLRVGLVGLGNAWETRHRPALRALGDRFEVRAVCEPVAHRADITAREFGATAVDGFRALACRQDVDALVILSSHWYGSLPILAACDAGKAVYCAASIDLDLEFADRIKARVNDSGIAFVSEFPFRQSPATLRLKELIATRLGQPRLIFCHQRQPVPNMNGDAKTSATRELVQLVDWCRYVVGDEPTSVLGMSHASDLAGMPDDYQMMSLDFSAAGELGMGAVAQVSCGRYILPTWPEAVSFRPPAAMQVACQNGIAFIDHPSTLIWFDTAGRHMESLDSERPVGEQLLLHFYRAATSLVRNTATFDDTYRAYRIVREARSSFQQGCRVTLT